MQQVTDWYQRAEVALDLKHAELALRLVVEGLAEGPECPLLLALGARVQYARQAYAEACEFARQAIGQDAESSEGYFWLAHAQLQLPARERQRAELAAAVRRVLEINPEDPSSHELAGRLAWIESGNLAEAARCYRRALELDPENNLSLQSLGSVTRHLRRWDESRELLEKLLALHPTDGDGWRELAWLHLDRDDPAAALHCGLAARDILPTDWGTFDVIARAALQLKDYDLALQAVRDLQAIDPSNSWVWSFGAQVLIAAGRYQEAYVSARRAVSLDLNNWEAHTWLVSALNSLVKDQREPFETFVQPGQVKATGGAMKRTIRRRRICEGSCVKVFQ